MSNEGKLLTGTDFKDIKLYKILANDFKHYNYIYKEGLNELPTDEPFDPSGDCKAGGLYVTDEPEHWMQMGTLIADVTLPPDAKVWTGSHAKYKVDKLMLSNIRRLVDDAKLLTDRATAVKHDIAVVQENNRLYKAQYKRRAPRAKATLAIKHEQLRNIHRLMELLRLKQNQTDEYDPTLAKMVDDLECDLELAGNPYILLPQLIQQHMVYWSRAEIDKLLAYTEGVKRGLIKPSTV